MPAAAARLNEQLCFALYSASNRLTAIYRPILAPLELTYPQFVVMMALWESDAISITELADRTHLSKATMTPLLKKLEDKSLLSLARATDNDRKKIVTVTPKGMELSKLSAKAAQDAFSATGISLKEAQLAINICRRIGI